MNGLIKVANKLIRKYSQQQKQFLRMAYWEPTTKTWEQVTDIPGVYSNSEEALQGAKKHAKQYFPQAVIQNEEVNMGRAELVLSRSAEDSEVFLTYWSNDVAGSSTNRNIAIDPESYNKNSPGDLTYEMYRSFDPHKPPV